MSDIIISLEERRKLARMLAPERKRFPVIDCQGERMEPPKHMLLIEALKEKQAAALKRNRVIEAKNMIAEGFEKLAAEAGLEAAHEHLEHLLHGSKHHG